jgi:hypothetical protein
MAVFYIPDFYVTGVGFNALNKSRNDLHHIYDKLGFIPLESKILTLNDEKVKYFASNNDILGDYVESIINSIDEKCHQGDSLYMDFPFAIKFAGYSKIVSYACSKGIKVVFFIHDLDGVRFQNPLLNLSDSSCLDMAYCLISASPAMDTTLVDGLRVSKLVKKVNYSYWDYLVPDKENKRMNGLVCFAGNLSKSTFIAETPDVLVNAGFNLYGKGMKTIYKGTYKGQYNPEELVEVLDGKFGLVWDGKASNTCSGNFGKYLRINTSHKFGLYMASSKPVIVWKESTLAKFVEKNHLGIAVSSLDEIAPIISNLNGNDYYQMRMNVQKIRKDVITGAHLSRVILSAIE